jgi:hypothetical protein
VCEKLAPGSGIEIDREHGRRIVQARDIGDDVREAEACFVVPWFDSVVSKAAHLVRRDVIEPHISSIGLGDVLDVQRDVNDLGRRRP